MTTDKARKRAVRSRMQKTGERYAAARRHVVHDDARPELPPRVAEPGLSEAAILKGTGRSWDEWFRILDAWDASTHNHTEIARYVNAELGVDGWWSQSVTVGYERARGMRAQNQRPEGFEVSVSKTVAMAPLEAWRAFVGAASPGDLAESSDADADGHAHDGPLRPVRRPVGRDARQRVFRRKGRSSLRGHDHARQARRRSGRRIASRGLEGAPGTIG